MDDETNDIISDFDIEQAKKLLVNIRHLGDLTKFQVKKPLTIGEKISMKEWVQWYLGRVDWYGMTSAEQEVVKMIESLDQHLSIIISRVEEGFRKLLTVVDKKDTYIKSLQVEVAKLRRIQGTSQEDLEDKKPVEVEADEKDKDEDEKDDEVEEKPKEPVKVSLFGPRKKT